MYGFLIVALSVLCMCTNAVQFVPLEDSYAAEVPEVTLAPNLLPLFRRQYDNHIFTGKC